MNNLSATTLRKLEVCKDHFFATYFTSARKERLNRDAVPILYENAGSSANDKNVGLDEMQEDNRARNREIEI